MQHLRGAVAVCETIMQHLHSLVAVCEAITQHLHSVVAVCEATTHHLHSVVAVCETTMQHLHSLVAVCETTMQHPHSLVAVCETTMQHLRSPFVMCAPTTGTIIHLCGMSGGANAIRPYTGTRPNFAAPAGAAPTCIRQTSLPPQGPPLPGYNHLAPGTRQTSPASADALPPPQLLGIVNA